MNLVDMAVALLVGLGLGYLLGTLGKDKQTAVSTSDPDKEWWKLRDSLTGTQLQILQYIESRKEVSIKAMQDKFSFIPDRELFYRLEQIVLMGFIECDRKHGEMVYTINADYAGRVEDDKTIILPEE